MKAHLAAHLLAVIEPFLPSFAKFVRVSAPHELLAALVSELLECDVVLPHCKCPLHIFASVLDLGAPDGLQGPILRTIHHVSIQLSVSPQIEHASQELLAHELVTQIMLLHLHLNRLEGSLMPLFDGNLHAERAKTLKYFHKLPQRVVAF